MTEVTIKNFEAILPEVLSCIENASFIAFDTEFTGLPSGREKSLFDNIDERYTKLYHEVSDIITIQFGLTTFRKDVQHNRYNANIFTFYLRPPSFCSVDRSFSMQASGLKFLSKYNFDFNKSFQDGIEYLNEDEARLIQNDMKTKSFLRFLISENENDSLHENCCLINQWLLKSKEDKLNLDDTKLKGIDDYIIFSVLRERNPGCWIYRNKENKLIAEKVTAVRREELIKEHVAKEEMKCFQTMLGFSRVFRKLVECKKPIVGHNCLCDLLLIFQQFHRPLPAKLRTFREDILELFPVIFDTKHICLDVKKEFEEVLSLGRGDLSEIYTTLLRSPTSTGIYFSPEVIIPGNNKTLTVTPHHAGFDSYACGFVFLKLAHLLAVRKLQGRAKPMTWVEHIEALSPYKNKINLIRSGDHFLDLSGGGACDKRPKWLYIKSMSSSTLDINKLTDLLSSYGTVDIKSLGKGSALIAVGNLACARDIVRAFYDNPDYHVTSYSHLSHSISGQLTLWSVVACFGGFSVALIFQIVKMFS